MRTALSCTLAMACLLGLATGGCEDPEPLLLVQLRTDLQAGVEYDRIEVEFMPATGTPVVQAGPPVVPGAAGQAIRVAERTDLAKGVWIVRVRLFDGRLEAGTGLVQVAIDRESVLTTVLVTRDCAGVSCPGDGDPGDIACLAGRCVDPQCSPETPAFCPPPECTDDTECTAAPDAPACAAGLCLVGVCGTQLDDSRCTAGMCLPSGCMMEADAGLPDAGPGTVAEPRARTPLALGSAHTCLRRAEDNTVCWGDNRFGQLGDSTTMNRLTASPIAGLRDAVLSLGTGHSCDLAGAGEVRCWGFNRFGQVGDGTYDDQPSPTVVMGLDATSVMARTSHTCAIVGSDDAVHCWGNNGMQQLGAGSGPGMQPTPVAAVGVDQVVDVRLGTNHSCALRMNGTVLCWGDNGHGQLGDRTRPSPSAPLEVPGLDGVIELDANGNNTCARRASGEVLCWGQNSEGQIGDGTTAERAGPTVVVGLIDAVQLALGSGHVCARRATGEVVCWGHNILGQLGDGTTDDRASPMPVGGLTDATDVASGDMHSCAQRTGGEVVCWGANGVGQLGDGTTTHRSLPTPVMGL